MNNFFKTILKRKLSFTIFKKSNYDIILLDNNYANLNLKNFKVIKYDENKIYLFYILKSLFKFILTFRINSFKKFYFEFLFADINPKIAIGHDIEIRIFDYKKYFPKKTITIVYQHGFYWQVHNERSVYRFKNKKSDYFLIFNQWHRKIFSSIKSKFIIAGSVKNNETQVNSTKKRKYDIMYISQFRKLDKTNINIESKNSYDGFNYANKALDMNYFNTIEIYFLKILNDYCKKYNKKLCIALASHRKEKKNKINTDEEIKYFSYYLEKFSVEKLNSFEISEMSNLNICLSSNLGPELLSRGKKVVFFNLNSIIHDWCFLEKKKDLGICWYKGINPIIIHKKINELLKMSNKAFNLKIKNLDIKINYDAGNKILKNIIANELKHENSRNNSN